MEQESGQLVGRRQFIRAMGATAAVGMTAALVGCSKSADAAEATGGQVAGWTGIDYQYDVDVLIVGAGASGLFAAYCAAKEGGKSVLVIDKQASYGGDAANAANDFQISYTKFCKDKRPSQASELQAVLDYADKKFPQDAAMAALYKKWYTAVDEVISLMAYEWGVEFDVDVNNNGPYKGMFFPKGGIGQGIQVWPKVYANVQKAGAEIVFNTQAKHFIVDADNKIVGLRAYDSKNEVYVDIKATNVILACGGFISSQKWVTKYYPNYANLGCVTTQALGEGLELGQSVGGVLSQYVGGSVALNAHTEVIFLAQMFGRSFSILPTGKRFCCETAVHEPGAKTFAAGWRDWISVWDSEIMEGPNKTKVSSGGKDILTGKTVAELAAALTMPVATLQAAFDDWNAICAAGVDKAFGRTLHLKPLQPPYYAYINHPVRYKSFGGLKINDKMQVLDASNNPIKGLYACGCTAGTGDIGPAAASGFCAARGILNA